MDPIALPPDLLRPVAPPQTRANIARTAEDFEATFLSQMLGVMFQGLEPAAPFGGGAGETAFRSFMTDAMARSMARAGGVGVSDEIQREMLRMQGLS